MDFNLKQQREVVALEAYGSSDLVGLVRRVFPTIQNGLAAFKDQFGQAPAISITGDQKAFLRDTIAKRTYNTLEPLSAYVPEGLKVSFMEYATTLFPAVEHAMGSVSVINTFATFLATLVSNKSSTLETASMKRIYTDLAKRRTELAQNVAKCFNNTTKTDVHVEDVIKRNSEWATVFETVEALSKDINRIERSLLQKKVAECNDLLDRIGRLIGEGHFEKVSPEVIMDLSDGAFQVAAELEFYSVIYYRVQAFTVAVSRTMEHVEKSTKEKTPA
ncbi:MAG: hypothetical protein P4L77_11365 [Sulfuriferula sp.]|nr:hypothetical protein [Sulfuriferula sp.]